MREDHPHNAPVSSKDPAPTTCCASNANAAARDSQPLRRRIAAYTAAASAIIASGSAEAAVVHIDYNQTIGDPGLGLPLATSLYVNGTRLLDAFFSAPSSVLPLTPGGAPQGWRGFLVAMYSSQGAAIANGQSVPGGNYVGLGSFASAAFGLPLLPGATVGSNLTFLTGSSTNVLVAAEVRQLAVASTTTYSDLPPPPGTTATTQGLFRFQTAPQFLGLRLQLASQQVFGFLSFSMPDPQHLTFLGLTYETSGAPIEVGAAPSSSPGAGGMPPVPEPGTLPLLALGAAGVAALRRQRRDRLAPAD
ncbi:MAG: PEP-CTERM sorting domain-containing protein [Planctomycetota bacterium]|nr:MAG: PEP-CTERM sorting domain-containing protein [Planctomycetota bacterium]